ncbi:hypothetical protein ACFSJY_13200 [Thalassotalea euphylliae]|uniref:hypothetical protein n=1 Tax=Thalassotalea euphylliae TaxID=1655234 RepID=UPI00363DDB4B
MWLFISVVFVVIAAIFATVSYRENLKMRATVYLIVRDQYKQLNPARWNEKVDYICAQPKQDVLAFINQANSDKLQSDTFLIIQLAYAAGFNARPAKATKVLTSNELNDSSVR